MNKLLYWLDVYIPIIILGIVMIGVAIIVSNKIDDCNKKGGTYVRGYCVSSEVIK